MSSQTAPLKPSQKRGLAGIAGVVVTIVLSWVAWLIALYFPSPAVLIPILIFLFALLFLCGNIAAKTAYARMNWSLQVAPAAAHICVSRGVFWAAIAAWVLLVAASAGIGFYIYAAISADVNQTVKELVNFITLVPFGGLMTVFLTAFRLLEPVSQTEPS
jgi:hypothetical protein